MCLDINPTTILYIPVADKSILTFSLVNSTLTNSSLKCVFKNIFKFTADTFPLITITILDNKSATIIR